MQTTAQRRNGPVERDIEIVDADVELGSKTRREHGAQREGIGFFGTQIDVAAKISRHDGVWLDRIGEYSAGRDPCCNANGANCVGLLGGRRARGTRIGRNADNARHAAIKLVHIGRPDRALILAAQGQIAVYPPVEAAKIGPLAANARQAIVGIAEGPIGDEAFNQWRIVDQRYTHFAENLVDRHAALGGQARIEASDVARGQERVRREGRAGLAPFITAGEPNRTGGKLEEGAGHASLCDLLGGDGGVGGIDADRAGTGFGNILAEDVADRISAIDRQQGRLQPAARNRILQQQRVFAARIGVIGVELEIGQNIVRHAPQIALEAPGATKDITPFAGQASAYLAISPPGG